MNFFRDFFAKSLDTPSMGCTLQPHNILIRNVQALEMHRDPGRYKDPANKITQSKFLNKYDLSSNFARIVSETRNTFKFMGRRLNAQILQTTLLLLRDAMPRQMLGA